MSDLLRDRQTYEDVTLIKVVAFYVARNLACTIIHFICLAIV